MPSPLSWLLSDRDPLPRPVRSAELFPFTMAFQPIVSAAGVFAQEALVRGPAGESAESILSQVHRGNLFAFDQAARVTSELRIVPRRAIQSLVDIIQTIDDRRSCKVLSEV